MIIIEEVLKNPETGNRSREVFEIEWYETTKTIVRRPTRSGMEIVIRKHNRVPLADGDILWMDDEKYIQLVIKPCECIVFTPKTLKEMGIICFEIGNKHIPIYIDEADTISVAYESPLYMQLQRAGYEPRIEERKLLQTHMLRAHGHGNHPTND